MAGLFHIGRVELVHAVGGLCPVHGVADDRLHVRVFVGGEAFLGRFEAILPKDEDAALTFLKCVSVMKSQVYTADGQFCQRWTTPNRLPHRWLWLWDSVFHGLGNFLLDETLPRDSLLSVLDVQKEDGFVPHLARPSFTSDITQPPVLAWGAVKLYRRTGDKDFLRPTR